MSISPGDIVVEHLRMRAVLEALPDDASGRVVSTLTRALAKHRECYTTPLLRASERAPGVRDIDRRLLESTVRSVDHLARRLTDCHCTGDSRLAISLALRELLREQERLERELVWATTEDPGPPLASDDVPGGRRRRGHPLRGVDPSRSDGAGSHPALAAGPSDRG